MARCLVGLGANLGDRQQVLCCAVATLQKREAITVLRRSAWEETPAAGGPAGQPPYLNGALLAETSLSPAAFLAVLQDIEAKLGRQRKERWGPRTIDLDLLLYDQLVIDTPSLIVPHPRMAWRRFVLQPAATIAGSMLHPRIGWSIQRLSKHLDTAAPYLAVTGPIGVGKSRLARRIASHNGGHLLTENFDSPRLEAFYADPPSHAWETELEFLADRARLVGTDQPQWANQDRLVISDFWLDQSLAFASVWLTSVQFAAFEDHWQHAYRNTVRPKLLVALDAPTEQLLERIQRRGRSGEQHIDSRRLDAIRRAIDRRLQQSDVGPVLRMQSNDFFDVCSEVQAAIEAMA